MELNLAKIFIALGGMVGCGIAGAWVAVSRATAAAQAQMADGDDALLQIATQGFGVAWRSGVRGFLSGALIGALLVGLYFWWTHPDRVRTDGAGADEDSGRWV